MVQQEILFLALSRTQQHTLQRSMLYNTQCSISAVSLSILWLMPSNFLLQLRDAAQETGSFLPVKGEQRKPSERDDY